MTSDHVAKRGKFLCQHARLAHRRIVVITGYIRLVVLAKVGAVHEGEICAAVKHVQIDRIPLGQYPVQFLCLPVSVRHVMLLAPMIEPSVPVLSAHQWTAWTKFL